MVKQNQNGQVILGLILVMVVALGIGLSIVQKSLVDISTSTKVEESSRSFSAAEAGIEKALRCNGSSGCDTSVNFSENSSKATVIDTGLLPAIPVAPNPQVALEQQALSREEIAHIWLADYTSSANPAPPFYKLNQLILYWGTSSSEKAALEVKVVKYNATDGYTTLPFYLDADSLRAGRNNFTDKSADCNSPSPIVTTNGPNRAFLCRSVLSGWDSSRDSLMLVRARFLYNTSPQPLAVQASVAPGGVDCSHPASGCYLPPQARILVSTGTSGETQRRVMLYLENRVVPTYFDYAIFSTGEVTKK